MSNWLITGARSGIGFEVVRQILSSDKYKIANLIATCRTLEGSPELKALQSNKKLHVIEIDLINFDQYDDFTKKVHRIVGDAGLNVLFHNAGVVGPKEGGLDTLTREDLLHCLNVNTVSPILLTQALLPLIRTAAKNNASKPFGIERAAIIYNSSVLASLQSNKTGAYWGYRESKAAGNMAMTTLSSELKKDGIATLTLHPGWVRTQMGGPKAPLLPEASAQGLLNVIMTLSAENSGGFYDYRGQQIPW